MPAAPARRRAPRPAAPRLAPLLALLPSAGALHAPLGGGELVAGGSRRRTGPLAARWGQLGPWAAQGALPPQAPAARKPPTEIPKQIAWLHIRKSGTSFINSLLHHKALCPWWPQDTMLRDADVKLFLRENRLKALCPQGFSRTYESPPGCTGIGKTFDLNEGRVMGFFRQPEQRIISDWYEHRKSEPTGALDFNFTQRTGGCAVKSLTRQADFQEAAWLHYLPEGWWPSEPCRELPPPTDAEVQTAVERVRRMAFVGLTEEWTLSVCLFHAMYGGPCHGLELHNTRPNTQRPAGGYNASEHLGGWTDPWDAPVYKEASRIFWARVQEYGLSRDLCSRACINT